MDSDRLVRVDTDKPWGHQDICARDAVCDVGCHIGLAGDPADPGERFWRRIARPEHAVLG